MSSMIEEFQDLDNFKMLPNDVDYGQQLQQAEIEHEYGSQFDVDGNNGLYEDHWRDNNSSYRPSGVRQGNPDYYREPYGEYDTYDQNILPPGRFSLTK